MPSGAVTGLPLRGSALAQAIEVGLAERGVLTVPGPFFGVDDGIRLAWSCPDDRFHEGLQHLESVLALG